MHKLTNPVSGKIVKNCPASYESITQIVAHYWPNRYKIQPTKPLAHPEYWKRVYRN